MIRLELSDADFDALRTLLARAAGLVFDDARRDSVAYCVAERMRETGAGSVRAYLALLEGTDERQRLLDEVTIQETHFFRNPPQVRALRQTVLPELLRRAASADRRLRIWSAGCSTGEEPYTLAMLVRELLPQRDGWDVQILATDVSERALQAARLATYGPRAVQMAAPEDLARFFVPGHGGAHVVRPEVREMVQLRHHNLVTDPVPFAPGEVDLVLCRNVTIYFGRQTTRTLMSRIHTSLRDGGYLFLGHSETLWQVSEEFRLVALGHGDSAAFVYRRQPDGGERRQVLPDRRTAQDGPPLAGPERRQAPRRTSRLWEELTRTRQAPTPDDHAPVRAALAAGHYVEAERLALDRLRDAPLDGLAHYLHGVALCDLGREPEALVALRKAVYLSPDDGFAHFRLAGTLERLGDLHAARREYRAAAQTLGGRPQDSTAAELGGRSVGELAALCRRLAQEESA